MTKRIANLVTWLESAGPITAFVLMPTGKEHIHVNLQLEQFEVKDEPAALWLFYGPDGNRMELRPQDVHEVEALNGGWLVLLENEIRIRFQPVR